MIQYRVGQAGATVYNADGKAIARLLPGSVVVEGVTVTGDIHPPDLPKRRKGQADKSMRAGRDFSVPGSEREDKAG